RRFVRADGARAAAPPQPQIARAVAPEEAGMTEPFPTRKQEEWRYADLEALQPVWAELGDVATLTVAAGETLEQVWLPTGDDVQVRRVRVALSEGARARIFTLNNASVYGRIELEVSLEADAD